MESVLMNGSDRDYDGACFYLHDVVVCFSKASGLYYTWQWWSLWQSLYLSQCCGSQIFIKNGSDGVCDGARFYLHAVIICFW